MADITKNSLTTALSQFITLNKNALEIFNKLNEAIISDKEVVNVDLFDEQNNLKRIQIPSFGFLKNQILRLENNVKNLSNLGNSTATIKLADGSVRQVITSELELPAPTIKSLDSVTQFEFKNNWFFEDFLNPLLYITIDVTNKIPVHTEKVLIKKYLLELDTEIKKQFFKDNLKGRSDIDFIEFNKMLLKNNIQFIVDDDYRDLPPRYIRYVGNFSILKITDVSDEKIINGQKIQIRKKLVKLNKLTYTDLQANFPDTVSLKVGDSLILNVEPKDTRYIVKQIDTSTNTVELELVEGFKGLSIGSDILSIYKEMDNNLEIEVPINFDKYVVLFIKPIDPYSKIPAEDWSPGIAFYTNELTLKSDNEEVVTLDVYYRNNVVDFGMFLLSLAKDRIIPATLALKPDPPKINASDLKVVQVNNHRTDISSIKDIKNLHDNKVKLQAEIKELDEAILNKRNTIVSRQYNNTIERDQDTQELNSLIERRLSTSKLLESIVKNINSIAQSNQVLDVKPKYHVRGFFPHVKPKFSKYTGYQEVIGYEIEYRYISLDGNANKVEQFKYNDNGVERLAAQSNWISLPPQIRKKVFDEISGTYIWEKLDIENADVNNINQIDIPISPNEGVEIRVRSISEAGYPHNPIKSDWSEIVRIDFPSNLVQSQNIAQIIKENDKEDQRLKLEDFLKQKGLIAHIDDQFIANEKMFKHNSLDIFSGFLSKEQKPISLFDKLNELIDKINELEAIVKKVKGLISVKILDENGNEFPVKRNDLVKIFAGYYSDIVANLNIKKGAIVTKTYFIVIENKNATQLELFSRIYGNRKMPVPISGGKFLPTQSPQSEFMNDIYFVNRGKYDYVPILYSNPINTGLTYNNHPLYNNNEKYINAQPYQSAQLKGQFLYCRYKNVAGDEEFYIDYDVSNNNTIDITSSSSLDAAEYYYKGIQYPQSTNNTTDYIWSGIYNNNLPVPTSLNNSNVKNDYKNIDPNNNNPNNTILLHILHPLLNRSDSSTNYTAQKIADNRLVSNSKVAIKQADDPSGDGKKQMAYFVGTWVDSNNTYKRTIKMAFTPDDQYTLGVLSVGSYLFLLLNDENVLSVDGDNALSMKKVEFGPNHALKIPFVFQYRMTDFGGPGTTGLGFIGGDPDGTITDLTYAKKMGIDICLDNDELFSFDIEVFAKYKSNKLTIEHLPIRNVTTAIDDLNRNLSVIPNININNNLNMQ